MIAHIHRNDLLVLNQQLERDAVRQMDGHRMQALKFAVQRVQRVQPQRRVRRVGFQQLRGFKVSCAQFRCCLRSFAARRLYCSVKTSANGSFGKFTAHPAGNDRQREAEASEWINGLIADAANAAR